jgi:hypothetical protein
LWFGFYITYFALAMSDDDEARSRPIEALNRVAEPFFSKLFSKANFSKFFGEVWKNSLEKVWKKVWKPERTPNEHVSSEKICLTLSEL